MDVMQSLLHPFFRTPTQDQSSLKSDDRTRNYTHIEVTIENFTTLELALLPSPHQQRAVEDFAKSLPKQLERRERFSFYSWDCMRFYEHFMACLERERLPLYLSDTFYWDLYWKERFLPLRWPDSDVTSNKFRQLRLGENLAIVTEKVAAADEDVAAADDSSPPPILQAPTEVEDEQPMESPLPGWVRSIPFDRSYRPKQLIKLYPAKPKFDSVLRGLHIWRADLFHVFKAFASHTRTIRQWISDVDDWDDDSHLRMEALDKLEDITRLISDVRLPRDDELRGCIPQEVDLCAYGELDVGDRTSSAEMSKVEDLLILIKDTCFMAEAYLATKEAEIDWTHKEPFCWAREDLTKIIAGLKIQRLRKEFRPAVADDRLRTWPHQDEDCCSICHEDLP